MDSFFTGQISILTPIGVKALKTAYANSGNLQS